MRILLLSSAFNGLTLRIFDELTFAEHDVTVQLALGDEVIKEAIHVFQPELIICPFLKHRIPESVWKKHLCLIVPPGIRGDRGPSSLDWAIINEENRWGVTLLQADAEMDAGDIWGTMEFPMRKTSKASLYRQEVNNAASHLIHQAIKDFQSGNFRPQPLDYTDPKVKGKLLPVMKQVQRKIDWEKDDTCLLYTSPSPRVS